MVLCLLLCLICGTAFCQLRSRSHAKRAQSVEPLRWLWLKYVKRRVAPVRSWRHVPPLWTPRVQRLEGVIHNTTDNPCKGVSDHWCGVRDQKNRRKSKNCAVFNIYEYHLSKKYHLRGIQGGYCPTWHSWHLYHSGTMPAAGCRLAPPFRECVAGRPLKTKSQQGLHCFFVATCQPPTRNLIHGWIWITLDHSQCWLWKHISWSYI